MEHLAQLVRKELLVPLEHLAQLVRKDFKELQVLLALPAQQVRVEAVVSLESEEEMFHSVPAMTM
jgi:hypothetical protein